MKQKITVFMAGLLVGVALVGGGAAYAAGITAQYNPQTVDLDGRNVQMEAYNIGGYNFVKLRDIGQAVGFNVYWADSKVHIDSDAPYTGEAPIQSAEVIRVGSYKGNTLKAGETSGLMVYPNSPNDTAVSSNPTVVSVKNVLGNWTATAQAPGTATVTITAPDGRTGSVTITVEPADPVTPTVEYPVDLNANMEIRQKMIRLINETRRANGVSEVSVNDSLMDAAQIIATQRYSWHHSPEEAKAVKDCGYPYGFGSNLTVFTFADDIAQCAVNNWINSPGHFQTMIDPDCDCIGVGVADTGSATYCYMFIGKPNSVSFYA